MKNLIVVPAYNEEKSLPGVLAALQSLPDDYEVVVVNDGSEDGTRRLLGEMALTSRLPVHPLHLPINSGIGAAMQTGYRFAARLGVYRYVVQFDADGQHDAAYLPLLVAECQNSSLDLCIGSRFLAATAGEFQSTWPRRLGSRFLA